MKALLVSPPFIPMYVNTDYNFVELGEIAGYLDEDPRIELTVADCSMLNSTWEDVLTLMLRGYDLLIIHNTIENYNAVSRTVELSRSIYPQVPIATYGRLSVHMAKVLEQLEIDVIVLEQDWEIPLKELCLFCERQRTRCRETLPLLTGCKVMRSGSYVFGGTGRYLEEDWRVPLLSKLPLDAYKHFDDEGGGLPDQNGKVKPVGEIAIGMSRGCDAKCGYCPIPKVNGSHERFRRQIDKAVSYLSEGEAQYNFGTASLFSANFTKDHSYVREFCQAFRANCKQLSWTCVTEAQYLSQDIVDEMAEARCSRVAIGVESLRTDGRNFFPWRVGVQELSEISLWFSKANVNLVGFVMVGMARQTRQDVIFTLKTLRDIGIVPRPMIYQNFYTMSNLDDAEDSFWFNRKLLSSTSQSNEFTNREKMLITRSWEQWLKEHDE